MREKEIVDESYMLQEAISSRPRKPLTHNQTRRLEAIDIYHKDLFSRMDRDIAERERHKEWEHRQFKNLLDNKR